jgi:hypothetical protein
MAETAFISPTVTVPSGLRGRCRQLLLDSILTARHLLDTSTAQRVQRVCPRGPRGSARGRAAADGAPAPRITGTHTLPGQPQR